MATVNKDFISRYGISGTTLTSRVASGTAPLTVTSTTLVANLNADQVDGKNASDFLWTANIASGGETFLGTPTSANLRTFVTDETGTGSLVFANTPTFVTPSLGVATATSINKVAFTAPATSATLTIADGKTLTASNTLTFTGTDSSSVAFGAGGTVAYTGGNLSQFAATTSSQLAGVISDETGSGVLVFGTSPAFTTSITTGSTTFALLNTTATTINFAGAATTLSIGASSGTTTVNNSLVVTGDLTVNGTTTNLNSTNLVVEDKNIIIADVATPSNTTADGAGITIKGATDKTFNWVNATSAFTASEHIDLASGKAFYINGTSVLTSTTLGSGVVNSSLTKIGALSSGIAGVVRVDASGNLTSDATVLTSGSTLDASKLSGTIPSGVLANSSLFIGTTSIALNRASTSQTLTGVSIDGNAGTATSATAVIATNGKFGANTTATVSANNTPTTLDSFAVATYTTAHYVIQMKQGTKMTSTNLMVNYDGTDVNITEYGYVDAAAGAANATISASVTTGTLSVTASSSDAATTNVVIKAVAQYVTA